MDSLLYVAGAVVAIAAAGEALRRVVRWMLTLAREIREFLADWQGEPSRPGVPARPGVMERLSAIEAELRPNGGGSIKDKINAIARATGVDNH